MGSCLACKRKCKKRTPAPAQLLYKEVTEITLKSSAHMTINPDNMTTYTISRSKQTNEKSGIEISNGEDEISIITSERAKIDSEKNTIPAVLSKTDTLTVANTPDTNEVSLPSLISGSDSPACSFSPEQTTAKNCSRSLPTVNEGTKKTEFRSLPGDSSGQFSKTYPLIITSTPPLPPLSHRNPITPLYNVGTSQLVLIYRVGDKLSPNTFSKGIKLPTFQGIPRCKEYLHDWILMYTCDMCELICRNCMTRSSPYSPYSPYRLNKLDYGTK